MSTLLHSDPGSESSTSTGSVEHTEPPSEPDKILVRFQAIGATRQLQPNLFKVSLSQTAATLSAFLKRRLRLSTVHLYISSLFEPTPDEVLSNLFNLFKTNNELVVSYCEVVAFG